MATMMGSMIGGGSRGYATGAGSWASMKPLLVEGQIVEYEDRLWRVGLVNQSRARLDPITGKQAVVGGHAFTSYGDSVNVGPRSVLPVIDPSELTTTAQGRLARLTSREDDIMAEETGGVVSAAPIPRRGGNGSAKSRAQKLARRPKNEARPLGAAKAKREPKPKVAREMKPCACGCGEMTGGYFIPGHDARFKGWLLALERGKTQLHGQDLKEGQERTPLPRKVQEQYKWVRRDGGWIPTTNYKGEPHKGYAKR